MEDIERLSEALDWRAVEMLQVLETDGPSTTTEIRDVTGMSNSQVRYRRRKLLDLDLIETRESEIEQASTPPTVHELTGKATVAIDAGLFEEVGAPEPGSFDELRGQVADLSEQVEENQEEIRSVRDDVASLWNALEMRVGGISGVDEEVEALHERLDDVEAEMQERVDDLREKYLDVMDSMNESSSGFFG